jgi:DNA-binding MarR family transcriptional regulator
LQRRRTREDARAYAIRLTEEGRRMLRTAEPMAKRVDERILDALSARQREQFLSDLRSIVAQLSQMNQSLAGHRR